MTTILLTLRSPTGPLDVTLITAGVEQQARPDAILLALPAGAELKVTAVEVAQPPLDWDDVENEQRGNDDD